jgi:uncharacterized repeat protein (TIGR01451 family)
VGTTTNTATADSNETPAASASATVIVPAAPALAVTKGVSLNAAGPFVASLNTTPGTTVWYQIVVTNTGNVPLTGITLTDSLGLPAFCTVPPTLAVGASFTCVYSRVAVQGTTTNTATADSNQTPPATAQATVVAAVLPPNTPQLSVSKGVSLNQAGPFVASLNTTPGTTVWYQIVVTNTGNVPLTGITLTDSLGLPASCTVPPTLAVGASFSCVYSRVAVQGTTTNTATAGSAQSPSASARATVVANPPVVVIVNPTASPTGAVIGVTSPPKPSGTGKVLATTAKPNITLPPTDTIAEGAGTATTSLSMILIGLAFVMLSAVLWHRRRPWRIR